MIRASLVKLAITLYMDLNKYGCACRCLLKLLEEEGQPMPEADFLNKYSPRFPFWQQQPGITSALLVFHLAYDLGLAKSIEISRDFDRIKKDADTGRRVLVHTERETDQHPSVAVKILYHVSLLKKIDDTSFTLWSPFQNGTASDLPIANRKWWDIWMATGIVLEK